jgi:type-F conjugative transfer system pilin assembly protein TrbC
MAKEKLLCALKSIALLVLMITFVGREAVLADHGFEDDSESLSSLLRDQAQNMTWEYLVETLKTQKVYGEDLSSGLGLGGDDDNDESTVSLKQSSELKIFVSSGMSRELLKSYAKEAKLYGGTLLLKGLPGGNFKGLSKLVMSLGNEDEIPTMQIDQEAFEKFEVNSVPVIVLAQSHNCFKGQSCQQRFDKVTGNIGIRAALELFKDKGHLAEVAKELLELK